MTLDEASKKFKIEVRNLKRMVKKNLISDPLTEKDIDRLKFLSNFWGKQFWLKRQLAKYSLKKREHFISTAGMSKVESYIYSRYINTSSKDKKVSAQRIAEEVQEQYGRPIDDSLMKLIYRIRKKVINQKFYRNKKR